MKTLYVILMSAVLFSCGNERILQLPEIENANITEIYDVSHAYLFYDVTKEDSIELNRKNLISTTNWLINVDKRLTLAQAIPKIKYLQDKKRNAEIHKNDEAKNYYTCNDTSIQNLGFLEFTDIEYREEHSSSVLQNSSQLDFDRTMIHAEIHLDRSVHIFGIHQDNLPDLNILNYSDFSDYLKSTQEKNIKDSLIVKLNFEKELSFQDYISFKSSIKEININGVRIDNREFIY